MEEIYRANSRLVYYYLYKLCRDRNLAEDLMQETFLQAMKSIDRYDKSCKMSVWLCQIAKHLYLNYCRKNKREIPMDSFQGIEKNSHLIVEEELIYKYELTSLREAINNLPLYMRDVVYLRVNGELSFRDIGECLGKSENWARVTFYRSKEKMIRFMKENKKIDL